MEGERGEVVQPAWTQEPKNSMRETSEPYINGKDVTII